jgi:phage terminase small subunit
MARTPKPRALKVLAGTIQPCRDRVSGIEVEPLDRAPEAPDWLPNAHAVKEWDRLAPILTKQRILAEGDLSTLGMLCALHGKIVQLYAAGETPTASMAATLRGMQSDFGLSAAARDKVSLAPELKPRNLFGANGLKPSAVRASK